MSTESKNSQIKRNHLWFNGLSAGHCNKDCRSSGRCHTCGKAHHTSLHRDPVSGPPAESSAVHTTAEQTSDTASANVTMPGQPDLNLSTHCAHSPDDKSGHPGISRWQANVSESPDRLRSIHLSSCKLSGAATQAQETTTQADYHCTSSLHREQPPLHKLYSNLPTPSCHLQLQLYLSHL